VLTADDRGKFGLGSKMALIWSKKSTGLPIEIETAHTLDATRPAANISHCTLDIDIHANEPSVRKHEKTPNTERFVGSKIGVVVEGNWSTYRSHILNYLQQLAIITPYAQFDLTYR
jgi:DNA topoisomerase VI subunit B